MSSNAQPGSGTLYIVSAPSGAGKSSLLQALLQVPADSRYIVSSLLMEDDDPGDVAGFLGQSEEEVQTGLEQALTALAEHLSGPALTFSHDEVAALYRELGERFAVDVSHLTRYCQ